MVRHFEFFWQRRGYDIRRVSDRHLSVIRDDGASRHKTVFDVGGLPVFEDNMTPKVISNVLGRQSYGTANKQEQKTSLSAPRPVTGP